MVISVGQAVAGMPSTKSVRSETSPGYLTQEPTEEEREFAMDDPAHRSDDLTAEDLAEMRKYEVTRVPVYYYQAGPYRYANLKDAIAQAQREVLRAGARE